MIFLGVNCLVLGLVFAIPILWAIGIALLVISVVLAAAVVGHAVGSRRHWF